MGLLPRAAPQVRAADPRAGPQGLRGGPRQGQDADLPRSQRGEGLRCLRPLGLLRHATRRFPQEEISLNNRGILCRLDRVQYRPVMTFAKHGPNMSYVGTVLISYLV